MSQPPKTPDFIQKLFSILSTPSYHPIIHWSNSQFVIASPSLLITQILPRYFRHSKLQSFVRQLNLYGFKKVTKPHSKEKMFFKNQYFKKDCPELLSKIQLKSKGKEEGKGGRGRGGREDFEEMSRMRVMELKETRGNFRGIIEEVYQQLRVYRDCEPEVEGLTEEVVFLLRMCGVRGEQREEREEEMEGNQGFMTHFLTKFNLEID